MDAQDTTADDRRNAARAPIAREVLFSGDHESGPLHEATATNITAEGLQLRTSQAMRPGTRLHLELHSAAGIGQGTPLFLDAIAVYAKSAGPNDFVVGLRFTSKIAVPKQELSALFLDAAKEATGELPVRFEQREKEGKRRRWLVALGILLLLFLAAMLGVLAAAAFRKDADDIIDAPISARSNGAGPSNMTWSGLVDSATGGVFSGGSSGSPLAGLEPHVLNLVDALRPLFPTDVPTDTIDRGYALLINGKVDEAQRLFERIGDRSDLTDLERFRVKLGIAQSVATLGNSAEAVSLSLELMNESTPNIPTPWQHAAKRLNQVLTRGRVELDALLLSSEVHLGAQSLATTDPNPPAMGPYIEVDKSDFVLALYRDGKRESSYPIGLGADDSTPDGRFTIANKIDHPTWYNKGNPVPSGDPRNPLGNHWLGLANASGPMTYGIHATPDLATIGANASAGCIRMRPDDAADIFARCEVGTPIYIHE